MTHSVPEEGDGKCLWELLTVLVTAHPDDESMFFVPTLYSLVGGGGERAELQPPSTSTTSQVWLLCLTTGNYNGLGSVRAQELQCAAESVMHVDQTIVLDNDRFPDDPSTAWDVEIVTDAIQTALIDAIHRHAAAAAAAAQGGGVVVCAKDVVVDTIRLITFDEKGVSGHVNHRDTFRAVRELWRRTTQNDPSTHLQLPSRHVEAWSLQTIHNPITKYCPVGAWIRLLVSYCGFCGSASSIQNDTEWTLHLWRPWLNWNAMVAHRSQFVWYRRLFVVFSCYTYVNVLRRIQLKKGEQQCNMDDVLKRQHEQKKRN